MEWAEMHIMRRDEFTEFAEVRWMMRDDIQWMMDFMSDGPAGSPELLIE